MVNDFNSEQTDGIIRIGEVLQLLGISKATIYRMMANGLFPKSAKISKRCVGWRRSVVRSWIDSNLAGA
jgi:prophage regulatory protein